MPMRLPKIITVEDFQKHFTATFWLDFARTVLSRHSIFFERLIRSKHGENVVFLIDDKFVIKIYTPFRNGFRREKAALEFAFEKTELPLPEIVYAGEIENFNYIIFNQIEGFSMTKQLWVSLNSKEQIKIISTLAAGLKQLHSCEARSIEFDWKKFIEHQAATAIERQKTNGANPQWLERLSFYIEENLFLLPENHESVFLHGDVHFGNLRFRQTNSEWEISGLFDFADSLKGFHEYEFVAIGVLMIQGQKEIQREFFRAYGYSPNEINDVLRKRLMLLTILYECSDLRKYALRLAPEAVNLTLEELEKAIWSF